MKEVEEVKNQILFDKNKKYSFTAVKGALIIPIQYKELFDSENLNKDENSLFEMGDLEGVSLTSGKKMEGTLREVYIPLEDDVKMTLSDKSVKQGFEDVANRVMGYIDETLEKHPDKKSGMNRVANAMKNQIEITTDPDYLDYLAEDPMYQFVANSVMVSLPAPFFYKTVNGVIDKTEYDKDFEKYDELLNKFSFISVMEERQKFMKEKTIPYVKAKNNGTLTSKMEAEYKADYIKMLKSQQKHFDNIKDARNNPDFSIIESNKTLEHANLFGLRWEATVGAQASQENKENLKMLNSGWMPSDLNNINKIKNWFNGIKRASENEYLSPNEIKKYKKQYSELKPLVDRLENETVTSRKQKYEIYKGFNDKIKLYASDMEKNELIGVEKSVKSIAKAERAERTKYFGKMDIKSVKEKIDNIYKAIKDVDFFMFGQGSKAFDDMLKAVKDAKTFSDKAFKNGRINSDKDVVEFMEKCTLAYANTEGYIARKDNQITDNFDRKTDRQKREQPRISAALDGLEGLGEILGTGEKALSDAVKENSQKKFREMLAKEEKIRSNDKTTDAEYERSVIRSVDMIQKASDAYYKQGNSGFKSYFNRVVKAASTKYPAPYVDNLYRNNIEIRKITKAVLPGVENPKDENGKRIVVTNDEIKTAYQNAISEKSVEINKSKDIEFMRKMLLSEKQQAKREDALKAAQNKAPKAPGK